MTGPGRDAGRDAPRGRRRGAELEAALLDAAWDELQAVGYADFTIDAVAHRAHTSRPVLYRRWPSRARLAHAAVRAHLPPLTGEIPDTGALRTDILATLRQLRDRFERVGPAIMAGLATELDELPSDVLAIVPDVLATHLDRAVRRGEIGTRPVPPHVLAVPSALLRHDLVLRRHRPDDADLARLVDDVVLPAVRHAAGAAGS